MWTRTIQSNSIMDPKPAALHAGSLSWGGVRLFPNLLLLGGSVVSRLNVETDAWPRMDVMAAYSKCLTPTAGGVVCLIWVNSQSLGVTEATAEDLFIWSKTVDRALFDRMLDAMCKPAIRFLRKKSEDTYEIIGNKKQITNLKKFKKRAVDASKKRWKKTDAKTGQKQSTPSAPERLSDATSIAPSNAKLHATSNATPHAQYNAIQSNTKQDNTIQNIYREGGAKAPGHIYPVLDCDVELAKEWKKFATERRSLFRQKPLEYFSSHIALIRNSTEFSEPEMRSLFSAITRSGVWAQKLADPAKVLKPYKDDLPALEFVLTELDVKRRKAEEAASKIKK